MWSPAAQSHSEQGAAEATPARVESISVFIGLGRGLGCLRWIVRDEIMSPRRIFIFAHAGVLVSLFHATAATDHGKFNDYIWFFLAIAIPTTVFRGLIADSEDESSYKWADGASGCFSYSTTVFAFAAAFANHNCSSGLTFAFASAVAVLLLKFGKRTPKQPPL